VALAETAHRDHQLRQRHQTIVSITGPGGRGQLFNPDQAPRPDGLVMQPSIGSPSQSVASVLLGDRHRSDEVTDEFELIDIVIKQFNAGRFFNEDHQLESLQPIKSEIFHEVRLIRDACGVDP
jgi:hypothetical protein